VIDFVLCVVCVAMLLSYFGEFDRALDLFANGLDLAARQIRGRSRPTTQRQRRRSKGGTAS
jgi:hypothetical protein